MNDFAQWIKEVLVERPIMVSDNPDYDWRFINYYFLIRVGFNPFVHSAERIGGWYAGYNV